MIESNEIPASEGLVRMEGELYCTANFCDTNLRDHHVHSCVKTFPPSIENHPQNVPLPVPTPKMHHGAIFQPAMPETWQECVHYTLATCSEGFVICFLKVTLVCLGSMAAAV